MRQAFMSIEKSFSTSEGMTHGRRSPSGCCSPPVPWARSGSVRRGHDAAARWRWNASGITIRSAVASSMATSPSATSSTPPRLHRRGGAVLSVFNDTMLVVSAVEGVPTRQTRHPAPGAGAAAHPGATVRRRDRPAQATAGAVAAASRSGSPSRRGDRQGLGSAPPVRASTWRGRPPAGSDGRGARRAETSRSSPPYVEDERPEGGLAAGRRSGGPWSRRSSFGFTITRAGTQPLIDGIAELLPSRPTPRTPPRAASPLERARIEVAPAPDVSRARSRTATPLGWQAASGGQPDGAPGGQQRAGKVTTIAVFERQGAAQQQPRSVRPDREAVESTRSSSATSSGGQGGRARRRPGRSAPGRPASSTPGATGVTSPGRPWNRAA